MIKAHKLLVVPLVLLVQPGFAADPKASVQVTISPLYDYTVQDSISGTGNGVSVSTEFVGSLSSRSASANSSTDGAMSTTASASGPGISNLASGAAGNSQWYNVVGLPKGASLPGVLTGTISGQLQASTVPKSGAISIASYHYSFRRSGVIPSTISGGQQLQSEAGFVTTRSFGSAFPGTLSVTAVPTVYFDALPEPFTATPTPEDLLYWGLDHFDDVSFNLDGDGWNSAAGSANYYADQILSQLYAFGMPSINLPGGATVGIGLDLTFKYELEAEVYMELASGKNVILSSLNTNANASLGGTSFASATASVSVPGSGDDDDGLLWGSFVVPYNTPYDLTGVYVQMDGGGTIPVVRAVPEPQEISMWAAGLLVIGLAMRRKQRRNAPVIAK